MRDRPITSIQKGPAEKMIADIKSAVDAAGKERPSYPVCFDRWTVFTGSAEHCDSRTAQFVPFDSWHLRIALLSASLRLTLL
jgi:hypothetical protein